MRFDDSIYQAAGLNPLPLNLSPAMAQVLAAGLRKTNGLIRNLTMTTAINAQHSFIQAADLAYMQVASGAMSYDQAIRAAVQDVAEKGLSIINYASGRKEQLDVAMRRMVLTGVSQTTGNLQMARADDMGVDLVQTSAHIGARPAHQAWQGKIFSRSGTSKQYPDFVLSTGYGTGAGLMGWNCRHSFYPFFEGISENAYSQAELDSYADKTVTYNGKEIPIYDATQMQRGIERKIRLWKRKEGALDAGGFDNEAETAKMKEWQSRMRDFIKQTGLQRQNVREQVVGVGRAGKVIFPAAGAAASAPISGANIPAFMKTYPGVTINLGGNGIIEKVVEDALDELQKQSYDFPKTIKIDSQFFIKYNVQKTSPCAYLNDVLYINDQHRMWKDPLKFMQKYYAKGYYSTDKPAGAIWHEVAHYLHEKNNLLIYNQFKVKGFSIRDDKKIATYVSKYAKFSADEFISEVFAAHVAKMDANYPLDVFLMFSRYGGVY
jgi:hypothetical protein